MKFFTTSVLIWFSKQPVAKSTIRFKLGYCNSVYYAYYVFQILHLFVDLRLQLCRCIRVWGMYPCSSVGKDFVHRLTAVVVSEVHTQRYLRLTCIFQQCVGVQLNCECLSLGRFNGAHSCLPTLCAEASEAPRTTRYWLTSVVHAISILLLVWRYGRVIHNSWSRLYIPFLLRLLYAVRCLI